MPLLKPSAAINTRRRSTNQAASTPVDAAQVVSGVSAMGFKRVRASPQWSVRERAAQRRSPPLTSSRDSVGLPLWRRAERDVRSSERLLLPARLDEALVSRARGPDLAVALITGRAGGTTNMDGRGARFVDIKRLTPHTASSTSAIRCVLGRQAATLAASRLVDVTPALARPPPRRRRRAAPPRHRRRQYHHPTSGR
jgi:hypothetical protein